MLTVEIPGDPLVIVFVIVVIIAPVAQPLLLLHYAKRLIGRRFSDASVQNDIKLWPFKIISSAAEKPMILVNYKGEEKQCAAEEISFQVVDCMFR